METDNRSLYEKAIQDRSKLHYLVGLLVRWKQHFKYAKARRIARKNYGITIDDYAWIPTKVLVLPSCRHIGYGAIVGSGSVVVKDIEEMSVVSGNPAKEFKKRKCVHFKLIVESLLGGDLQTYKKIRKQMNINAK